MTRLASHAVWSATILSVAVLGCSDGAFRPGDEPPAASAQTSEALVSPAGSEFQPAVKWGGRAQAVAIDPNNLNFIITATDAGGLRRSVDGGNNWTHLDNLRPTDVTDVAICPTNPQIVYAGAFRDTRQFTAPGSATADNDGGIWFSVDGGNNWNRPANHAPAGSPRYSAHGIAFGATCNDVYIGTSSGLAITHNGAGLGASIAYDSINGTNAQIISVAVQPGGTAGAAIIDVHEGAGVRRSITGGGAWSTPAPATGPAATAVGVPTAVVGAPHSLAQSPTNPNVIFASTFNTATTAGNRNFVFDTWQVYESDDGGATWTSLVAIKASLNRIPFVFAQRSRTGSGIDVYLGDGTHIQRQTCNNASGLVCNTGAAAWTFINMDSRSGVNVGGVLTPCLTGPNLCVHQDESDMVFNPANNCPVYVAGDGGMLGQFPLDPANPTASCGDTGTWRILRGSGGPGSFASLELFQVTGQVHANGLASDLYFATQDDDEWGSIDNGQTWPGQISFEGSGLQLDHFLPDRTNSRVVGMTCAACFNYQTAAGFTAFSVWPNPAPLFSCPDTDKNNACDACANRQASGTCDLVGNAMPCTDANGNGACDTARACVDADSDGICDGTNCVDNGFSGDDFGNRGVCDRLFAPRALLPVLIAGNTYVQWDGGFTFRSGGIQVAQMYRTTDAGVNWTPIPNAIFPAAAASPDRPFDLAQVSGPVANPVLYQAVSRPFSVFGLIRIDGALGASATVTAVDIPGGSLAGTFVGAAAYGVNPSTSTNLITVDQTGGGMRRSTNSGTSWSAIGADAGMAQLTKIVTRGGEFSFIGSDVNGNPVTQVDTVQFDSTNAQRILVGTQNTGVIASSDGGNSWARLCGTERIPRIASFFFDNVNNTVYASSFGRGLWKLDTTQLQVPTFSSPPANATATNCGAVNIGTATATDSCEGAPVQVTAGLGVAANDPSFGCSTGVRPCGNFPKGNTTVTWSAVDAFGDTTTTTSTVTVTDTTKPIVVAPPNVTITTCVNAPIGRATATDRCDGTLPASSITSNAPAHFPLGNTTVTWFATDAAGNVGTATQVVTALLGDDPTCCPIGTNIIVGDNNANRLDGTAGSDCIIGRGGNDTINSFGGVDYISSGSGNDIIAAGTGNDFVFGGDGNDTIDSGPGNDFTDAGNGTDTCTGGTGVDAIAHCEVMAFCTAACCSTISCSFP